MANKFLDQNGLIYLWSKFKGMLEGKVDKVDGMGLSEASFTAAEKEKLSKIADGANKTIVDNTLTSTSTTDALAAAQGKALNDKIDELENSLGELGYGDMLKSTYDADNDGKVDNALHAETADKATNADSAADAAKFGGQAPAYYAKATDIPTNNNQLENGAGYITSAAIPTKVSAFENDANYLTEHQDISGKLDKTGDASNTTVTFTTANERTNVATGEKLTTILGKIAKYFADLKTVAFTGKYSDLTGLPTIPTVTNDLTNELKAQYDTAYTHSQEAHAPANAQANVLESVSVNGTKQTITDKGVNISVPTSASQLSDYGTLALKSDITNVYKYKGSVATASALPTSGNTAGDVYNVEEDNMNYAWNGSEWDPLGEVFEIESITNADIDAILAA